MGITTGIHAQGNGLGVNHFASWEDLLDRPSPNNGDVATVNNTGVYKYNSSLGLWLNSIAYDGTPLVDISLSGTATPTSEGWIESALNGGSIDVDGGVVTFNAFGVNNETANATYDPSVSAANHWAYGYIKLVNNSGTDGRLGHIKLSNGTKRFDVSMRTVDNYLRFMNGGTGGNLNNTSYINNSVDMTSNFVFLEMYLIHLQGAILFADHQIVGWVIWAALANSADTDYTIGDSAAAAQGETSVYDWKFGRF